MSSINFATREISCKIVYYGPGLSGKTTNLQVIHQKIPREKKTEMVSLATEGDRTLFFDFLPLNLGSINGFKTKFQLYTVPGQVYYNSTRKLVLRGVDGVVFVADSAKNRQAENLESLQNLRQNLADYGLNLDEMPFIIQFNKRDLPDVFTLEELNERFNPHGVPWFPATAHNGKGVIATLKAASRLVIENFNLKQGMLKRASDRANNTGVHDLSFSGNEVKLTPASESPTATSPAGAPGASSLFESAPEPTFQKNPEQFAPLAAPDFSEPDESFSFSAPANTAESEFVVPPQESPFIASAAKAPQEEVKKPAEKAPASDDMDEEEIELRPYVPKTKRDD
jgi:signal recognition particle receptor subunit beta